MSPKQKYPVPNSAVRAALGLCGLLASLACSGPDLTPTVTPDPTPAASDFQPVLPSGGECASATQASQPAELEQQAAPAGDPECPNGTPIASQYNPLRPLGVGYQEGDNPIPPRFAYLTFDDG